ncbi:uncharacterized protein LOC114254396 [Monomorium pharaonis]|uniref:uncharacterized protein LOC114254396 n=1 Tax=Monomorium pharaonis TaxID=307658 RepID=UPI001746F5D8|nr:uncharacterized protein LOC114254396 [Monomorium pharaonis]
MGMKIIICFVSFLVIRHVLTSKAEINIADNSNDYDNKTRHIDVTWYGFILIAGIITGAIWSNDLRQLYNRCANLTFILFVIMAYIIYLLRKNNLELQQKYKN